MKVFLIRYRIDDALNLIWWIFLFLTVSQSFDPILCNSVFFFVSRTFHSFNFCLEFKWVKR